MVTQTHHFRVLQTNSTRFIKQISTINSMIFKTMDNELKVFGKTIFTTTEHLKNLEKVNATVYNKNGQFNLQGLSINTSQPVSNFTKLNNAFKAYNGNLTKSTQLQNAYIKAVGNQNGALGNYLAGLNGAKASMGGYIKSLIGAKAATIGLQVASTLLNTALSLGLSLALSAIVSEITHLINKEKEAREQAIENAQTAKKEADNLTELLNKYNQLSEEIKTNTGVKDDLLETQGKLLESLGIERSQLDGLIKKYGDLNTAINKVTLDSLNDAQADLMVAVDAREKELINVGKDYKHWFSPTNRNLISTGGKESKQAYDILSKAGIISQGSVGTGGGVFTLVGDDKTVDGILENYQKLKEAQTALNEAVSNGEISKEDMGSNPLYKAINSRLGELKKAVDNYNSAIKDVNENSANQEIISNLIGKDLPQTEEEFETFKQSLIDSAQASNNFIGSQEEIKNSIINTLAEMPEFKKYFDDIANVQKTIVSDYSPTLFSDLFNNDSIDKTKQKLLDLATSGELSAETITSTEDYKALLDELGISADEFVNKISEFNIQYNEDNYNSLIDLLSRVRKGEILSADEATTLIATYDSLAGELVKTGNGYSFNESAIISLTNKYAETSNLAISNEVKKTNAAIEGVKERINAYGIEMEALKTIQKIYEDTGSKIEVMNWLKDNGYSMFMASNYLDIANEYSELEKKSESLKSKMLEQIETSTTKSTETALDRITKKYKELTDVIGSNVNLIKSQISLLETRGSTVGRAYYDELISQSTEKIKVLTEQYNELRKQFLQTDRGTEEWLELNAAILETQDAIIGAKTDIEGFQNSIDKLHWDELDKIADAIGNISDEAKSVVDLLDTDDVLDDNGNFTKDAITALAMYGEQLESAQYLINKYSKEIEYLNGEYTKGTITVEEYNEKMQDLNDKQWESVDAYNAAKKAIIELRKKGIDEEIDALEELYDARKKAWEQEKDQHDWEKTVSENETNINKLKAQIAELQNDNSLAGIKKRKELEDELKKTESDWEDTLYDHVYDERQDQLDKELDDKKKALEKTLDDEEKLVADSIDLVNKNSTTVLDNLNRLSREYGIQMSNSLTEPFTHGENALSHYSTMFSEANSAFTDQLNYTAMGIYQLQLDADNAAVSVVNMFNSANGTLLEQLSLVRQSLQEITDKANEAANAVRNAGIATPTTTTTTASNSTSSTNRSLGDMAHDTSGTTLPNAGTWKNVQNDIEKAKKDLETIEKQKKVGLVKNTSNKFTTISMGYASGTKSATKGLHPIYEDGVEIIEKDGCLIYPIGAFDGGEKVFNNEQTQRLWELSQNPDVMEKFRQELLNIKPCIDFKFGNTAPVTKTNQNVNVQQHFDALVKVEGDMTPDVLAQLTNDRKVVQRVKDIAMEGNVEAYNTRGYRIR